LFFFLHLGLTAAAVFLKVTPNRQQFFTGESVHLSCEEEEDGKSADGWTLKRVWEHQTKTFGVDKVFQKCSGATYTVPALSAVERGVYWCEDPRGNKTINVTLTVSGTENNICLLNKILTDSVRLQAEKITFLSADNEM
ncbi:hypothetical protein AMECASPLE_036617, partial [Ameca splendens]